MKSKIIVNGRTFEYVGTSISYDNVARQAGYNPSRILSITWSYFKRISKDVTHQAGGILMFGMNAPVVDGMVFVVSSTGDA